MATTDNGRQLGYGMVTGGGGLEEKGYLRDATDHYGLWFFMARYVCGARCIAC